MFDVAQFGDRFKTRDGRLAIYFSKNAQGIHALYCRDAFFVVDNDGRLSKDKTSELDIIGIYD